MKIILTAILVLSFGLNSFTQTKDDKVKAYKLALEAIKEMEQEEFDKWYSENEESFDKFIDWFSEKPLTIDKESNFHRTQYK